MKRYNLLYIAICLGLMLTSCNDFLDEMPDNRAEIDTESKITSLLVSAYPSMSSLVMEELATDNAKDNGDKFSVESQEHEDAYLWKDITNVGNDSPKSFWDACYGAIAAANQALNAIDNLGNPKNLQPQRGEALICRAYAHFALANMFCLPYNPETAGNDMGIPYSEAPETKVSPQYERGTMQELYEKINADIEEGLPLINDDIYSVPKYHFNRKAAHAFAARFNLFYHNYDKVIQYANVVLGNNPAKMMRDWSAINSAAADWDVRVNMYISAGEPCNLLMIPVTSSWGYWGGPYNLGKKYGHSKTIFTNESVRAAGLWGSNTYLYMANSVWGSDEKMTVSKIGGYFHYTDKVNGIGYRKNVNVIFSANETLLCRAEAYTLKGEYDKATEDINTWIYAHTSNKKTFTTAAIVEFYAGKAYMPTQITEDTQRSIKKVINPRGFTVAEGDQENMIQCILHLRRVETVHEGLRWHDIKRYGIEIAHNREGMSDDILTVDDPRRALQLPQDVISAGLTANPRN